MNALLRLASLLLVVLPLVLGCSSGGSATPAPEGQGTADNPSAALPPDPLAPAAAPDSGTPAPTTTP
jgi:hypothetical protein